MKKPQSRLQNSKEVRRVLSRNGVDLTICQYQCAGMEVRLTGILNKIDGSDFNSHQIEAMMADFANTLRGFTVVGECENWSFASDHITFLGSEEDSGVVLTLDLDEKPKQQQPKTNAPGHKAS